MPEMLAQHFKQASEKEEHGQCMQDNAMFNNRQLMVSPNAVENAWTYCLNQSGLDLPEAEAEAETEQQGDPQE